MVSPRAAAQGGASSPRSLLEQVGLHVGEQLSVADLAGDRSAAKRWRQYRYWAIIAAGGDGTIGTTVTHLAGTGIPLGILPMGTSNDVARALGIPLDPAAAAAVIAGGVPTAVDVGLVREAHGDTRPDSVSAWRRLVSKWLPRRVLGPRGRDAVNSLYFLHAATLGLNVEFAQLATDASRRAALGSLTYPASSLEALMHLRSIAVTLRLSGVPARDPTTGRQLAGIKSDCSCHHRRGAAARRRQHTTLEVRSISGCRAWMHTTISLMSSSSSRPVSTKVWTPYDRQWTGCMRRAAC